MPEASEAGLPSSVTGAGQEQEARQEGYVHKETLPNGLRVMVHEMPGAQAITEQVFVNAGPRYEDAATIGAGHYLEHLNYEGSEKNPSQGGLYQRAVEAGVIDHAHTQREYITYAVQIPPDKLDQGLDYLEELVFHPVIPQEAVEQQRDTIAHERRSSMDLPDDKHHMWTLLCKRAWGSKPVGQDPMGTEESLQSISREDLAGYHRRQFTPDNSILVISGNITTQEAIDMATRKFGGLSSSTEAKQETPSPTQSPENRVLIEQRDLNQTYLGLTFNTNGIGESSEMMPQIQVLSNILGNKLNNDFVYGLRYSYFANAYPLTLRDDGQIVLRADVAPENAANAMRKMIELVQNLQIDEQAVQQAKTVVSRFVLQNPADTDEDAAFIGKQELFRGKVLSPDEIKSQIQAVTVDELQRLKDTLLTAANAGMVILGNVPPEKKTEFESMLNFE